MDVEAYCMKCKATRKMNDAQESTMENGRRAAKGICPVCGTKMTKFLPSDKTKAAAAPEKSTATAASKTPEKSKAAASKTPEKSKAAASKPKAASSGKSKAASK